MTTIITTITTASKLADYYIWFANDVGSYLSNHKLQKLLYYAQAWYLAFEDTPLFDEDFEAWVHGPTIPALLDLLQKKYVLSLKICSSLGQTLNYWVDWHLLKLAQPARL